MAVTGAPVTYHKKFKFLVYINGVVRAAFNKAGPLEGEIAVTETFEGGAVHADKSLGRVKTTNIKLERGATNDRDLWDWFAAGAQFTDGEAADDTDLKRTVEIAQQTRSGREVKRWRATEALCCKFTAGDWDNGSDENTMESAEIAYKTLRLLKNI